MKPDFVACSPADKCSRTSGPTLPKALVGGYREAMDTSNAALTARRWNIVALVVSALLLLGGVALSLMIDDWIALICASGLAVLPLGVSLPRSRK
jgi:hypothetical protein